MFSYIFQIFHLYQIHCWLLVNETNLFIFFLDFKFGINNNELLYKYWLCERVTLKMSPKENHYRHRFPGKQFLAIHRQAWVLDKKIKHKELSFSISVQICFVWSLEEIDPMVLKMPSMCFYFVSFTCIFTW